MCFVVARNEQRHRFPTALLGFDDGLFVVFLRQTAKDSSVERLLLKLNTWYLEKEGERRSSDSRTPDPACDRFDVHSGAAGLPSNHSSDSLWISGGQVCHSAISR